MLNAALKIELNKIDVTLHNKGNMLPSISETLKFSLRYSLNKLVYLYDIYAYKVDVEQSYVRFLGNLVLNLWDCGG